MRAVTPLIVAFIGIATLRCDVHGVEETVTDEFRFDVSDRTPPLDVRLDNGSVTIEAAPGDLEVSFTTRARAASREAALAMLEQRDITARDDDDAILLRGRTAASSVGFHARLNTNVHVRLPYEAQLDILTKDGRIELDGVSGRIVAETEDGRIRLRGVRGTVKLYTGDGSIAGEELEGDFDVVSDDGSIRLSGEFNRLRAITTDGRLRIRSDRAASLTDDWHLRTSDGSIVLSLPRGLSADLEASATDGRVENELEGFEGRVEQHFLEGRLGDGGKLILIETLDGRITLRSS